MASTQNAFTGYIPHSTPLRDDPAFRTRIYAQWIVVCKDSPLTAPTWKAFQAAALAKEGQPSVKKKKPGMGISVVSVVAPIKGLSKQARAQLAKAPRSISMGTLSDGNRRSRNKKAAI